MAVDSHDPYCQRAKVSRRYTDLDHQLLTRLLACHVSPPESWRLLCKSDSKASGEGDYVG